MRTGRKPLVARFGGIPLRRQKWTIVNDRPPVPVTVRRKELITRLLADMCELCKKKATVEVHHVRNLNELAPPGRPQPVLGGN